MSFLDILWFVLLTYLFVAYLVVLFHIISDIFRDRELGGFAKALWVVGLIVVPVLVALFYLIARGKGMAERSVAAAQRAQADTDQYIRSVVGTTGSADQIASAKALLDDGSITQTEFDQLKAKALA